jgi:predicted PurR-regulated permease PerM
VADDRPLGLRPLARTALELLLVAAALALVAVVAVKLRLVVLPVILAVFLSVFLVPPTRWLHRRGLPKAPATLVAMLAVLAVLGGLLAVLVPPVVDQAGDVQQEVVRGIDDVLASFDISDAQVDRYIDQGLDRLQANGGAIGQGVVSGALLAAEAIAGLLLALVLVFFFVKDGPQIWRWVVAQAPRRHRDDIDVIGHRAWATIGGYLRGVTIIAAVDAILIGAVLAVLGVPLVLPLAALTFFGAFFPLVGATAAGIAAALVTLVTEGTFDAIIVVVAILAIQELEGDILYPMIVGRAIRLHPVAVLLLLTAGSVVAGIAGALLAIPFGAVVWEAVRHLRDKGAPPGDDPALAPPPPG